MENALVQIEIVENKIHTIRGQRVMLDSDLALLYGVETGALNRAVKRNIDRFPEDFMFRLANEEWENLKCQFGISSSEYGGRRKIPYVFTEQGVAMLSSVLNSKRAIAVNVQIMRVFVKLRQLMIQPVQEIAELKKLLMLYIETNDARVNKVIQALNNLLENPKEPGRIGFKTE